MNNVRRSQARAAGVPAEGARLGVVHLSGAWVGAITSSSSSSSSSSSNSSTTTITIVSLLLLVHLAGARRRDGGEDGEKTESHLCPGQAGI